MFSGKRHTSHVHTPRNRRIALCGVSILAVLTALTGSVRPGGIQGGPRSDGRSAAAPGVPAVTGHALPATPPGPGKVLPQPARPAPGAPLPPATRVREQARTANATVYQLSDGRVQAEVAAAPVHYRDAAGRWQDIDTRVSPTGHGDYPYAAERNAYTSRFGATSDRLIGYALDGHGVRVGLAGPARPLAPKVSGSTVTYPGAFDRADLVYDVTAGALKEKIVLHAPPADGAFRFTLDLDGVDPVQRADGSIEFLPRDGRDGQGPALFTLPAPFMYDSRADPRSPYGTSWSGKVGQAFTRDGDRLTVTITPDEAWLRAAGRQYPVTVDPTIKIQPTPSDSQDAMITSDAPTTNYDGNWRLSVGTATNYLARSLLKFDVSALPAGVPLDSAQLQVYFDQTHTDDRFDVPVQAVRVTSAWSENTVTWGSINGAVGEVGQNAVQVDNGDTGKALGSGAWSLVTDAQAVNGGYAVNKDTIAGDTWLWMPRITEAGSYRVEVHYVAGADRGTAVPYTVNHAAGTTTVNVDQSAGTGGVWKSIGTWSFNAGTTHRITMGDAAGKTVVADAVRFIKTATDVKTIDQANVWHTYSVRSIVQDWLDGRQPNYGFMLKAADEVNLGRGGPRYEAAEYAYDGEHRNTPKLLVTWGRPSVTLDPPATMRATGADLTWSAYADPSSSPDDDLVEYQVHRSVSQNFQPSAQTLVAPVPAGQTSYGDTSAAPTAASDPQPFGNAYYYMVAVKTRDGSVVAGQTQQVRLPKAGQVLRVFADGVDTTLSSTEAGTGHDVLAGHPWQSVGNNSGTYGRTRTVLKFPSLSGVPGNAKVLDAQLNVWGFSTTGSGATYEAHALTRDFNEAGATWNSAAAGTAWTTPGGDYDPAVLSTVSGVTNDPTWRVFDADATVQRWVSDASTNKGFLLRLANETSPAERTIFLSGEGAEPKLRPKLTVLYTEPTTADTYYAPTTPDRMIPGDQYTVPVTLTNTTNTTWSAASYVLSYRWKLVDGTDVTNSGNQRQTALAADLPPGGVATVNATVMTPIRSDAGNKREQFVLEWDLFNKTTGQWLSQSAGIPPLPQNVTVEDPTSDQLGLEKFYQYRGEDAGAGSSLLVNEFSGNAVFGYNAFSNPGRGLATSVRLTYNSTDTSKSFMGYGWSLSTSSVMRLGSPIQFRGAANQWPIRADLTDGDGTTHYFTLNKHNSTDSSLWTYDEPAGVHLYLQRTNSTDSTRQWVMTRPDRTQVFFDNQGYQTALRDKNGNELLLTYERKQVNNRNSGVLRYLTDPAGRTSLTLEYYAKGDSYEYYANNVKTSGTNLTNGLIVDQLKTVTDISGRQMKVIYSDKGLLQEVVDGVGDAGAKSFKFFYDDTIGAPNAKLLRIVDPRGNSTSIAYYLPSDGPLLRWRAKTITDRAAKATGYTYVDPDGTTGSQITATVTDANAHAATDLIDGFGRLTKTTNAKNQTTELTWDADNNVRRLAEANGAVTTWVYDQNTGYPLEIKDAEANKNATSGLVLTYRTGLDGHVADLLTKTSPEGRGWQFGYDLLGNLTSVTDPKGTATTTVGDFTATYTYDSFGQLVNATDANEHTTTYTAYDNVGYPGQIIDPLGHRTLQTYDVRGNVLTVTDARLKQSTYTYDVFGRLLTSKVPKDAANNVYLTNPAPQYDPNDNVTRQTAPNGAVTTVSYDPMDRRLTVTQPRDTSTGPDRTTTYTYDAVGNMATMAEPKGTLSTNDPNDFVVRYAYDELNQNIQITDAIGGKATIGYDNVGNIVVEVDQRKNATADTTDFTAKYAYDLNHRPTVVTDAAGQTTGTEYDRDGNATATVDQEGNKTLIAYDERSAVSAQKVPYRSDNGVITYHTTRFEYDEVGNRVRVTSPRGTETTTDPDDFAQVTVYNEMNRPIEQWQPFDRDDSRYTAPSKVLYSYDEVGNVTDISAPPSAGQTTRNVTHHTYFDNGWTSSTTDPWNVRTEYDYNELGQQTRRRIIGGGNATRTMTWTYYPDGKQQTRADDGAAAGTARKSMSYTYDVNANLTQISDTSTDAKIDTYAMEYDGVNRLSKLLEKAGTTVRNTTTFTYDPSDNLLTRTHDRAYDQYTYDVRDLPSEVRNARSTGDTSPKVSTFQYTPRQQVSHQTKPNGNTVDFEYWLDGSMRHQVEKKPSGTVVDEHTIDYDANSNRLKDVTHKQSGDNIATYLDTTYNYTYDPLDRVRSVAKTGVGADTESYIHDDNNNVIQQTTGGTTTSYTYDRNRLVSSSSGGASASYEYDAWGRLARVASGATEIERYAYDGFDRTTSHTSAAGGTTTYTYDALDRQRQRTHGGKTTDLSYLGLSSEVLTEEEGGQLRKLYQRGSDGRLLSQIKFNTDGTQESTYHGYNPRGDVEQITGQQGDAKATYGYTAYGKNDNKQFSGVDSPDPTRPDDPNKEPYNAYRFNAKRFDQATGDYNMGFRDYDPGINRFLARDSYNGALSDMAMTTDPYTHNRYAFAGGNPITNVELDGHSFLSDIGDALKREANDTLDTLNKAVDWATGGQYSSGDSGGNKSLTDKAKDLGHKLNYFGGDLQDGIDPDKGRREAAQNRLANSPFGELSGIADAKRCDEGNKGACAWTAANFIPGLGKAAKGLKEAKNADKMLNLASKACKNSFVPGTLVLMANGRTKPIEAVQVGDEVATSDPTGASDSTASSRAAAAGSGPGKRQQRPVTTLIIGEGYKHLVELTVDVDGDAGSATGTLTATENHPFWVEEIRRWVDAGDLHVGNLLRTAAGSQVRVTGVRAWTEQRRVHNLTVADLHTYYVVAGGTPVLVHNCGGLDLSKFGASKSDLTDRIRQVVDHFDMHGRPPAGTYQGGAHGYPPGTYLNRNGQLPGPSGPAAAGRWTESDIWPFQSHATRGAERLVFGLKNEVYYTWNHYDNFLKLRG